MKKIIILLVFIGLSVHLPAQYDAVSLNDLNWKLSCQAYTFKEFSFMETLDKLNQLGIRYVEIYPNQVLGDGTSRTTNYKNKGIASELKKLLKSKNIEVLSYGVVTPKSEADWKELFSFAKELGISTLISEPSYVQLDLVEKLADVYNIKVAIHNHPAPTSYFDPEIILSKLKGRSSKIGVCADIGHFVRSGISSLEAVQKLRNRIICLHMKDLNKRGDRSAHDVPWGTGICNIPGVLNIMKTLGPKSGLFMTIEYEYNWKESQPEVAESIEFFYRLIYSMTKMY